MRPTPIRAALWLFWRWVRWQLVAMGAVVVVSYAVWYIMDQFSPPGTTGRTPDYPPLLGVVAMLLMCWAWVVAIFWPSNATEGERVFAPERLLRLPVKTWQLAAGYVVPGIVFAVGFAWAILFVAFSLAESDSPLIGSQFLELGVWMLVLTALPQCWLLIFGIHHARVGIVLGVVLGLAAIWIMSGFEWGGAVSPGDPAAVLWEHPMAVCLGVAFLVYGLAIPAMTINRSGGFGPFSLASLGRLEKFEWSSAPARRFRSAEEAQRWYEWRKIGWHLPVLSFAFLFVYYGLIPGLIWLLDAIPGEFDKYYSTWVSGQDAFVLALLVGLICPTVIAGVFSLGIDFTEHFRQRSTFYFTRPRGHWFLIRARYGAVAKNIAITGIPLFAVLMFFPDTRDGLLRFMTRGFDYVQPTPLSVAVGIGFVLAGIWALYWPLNVVVVGFVSSLIVPSVILLGVVHQSDNYMHEWYGEQFVFCSCVAIGFVQIDLLARVVCRGLRSKAFVVGHVLVAATLWAAVVVAMVWYMWYGSVFSTGELQRYEWATAMVLLLSVSLLPAVAVITTPYLFHEWRHRR